MPKATSCCKLQSARHLNPQISKDFAKRHFGIENAKRRWKVNTELKWLLQQNHYEPKNLINERISTFLIFTNG
jgi:hypothetical protein